MSKSSESQRKVPRQGRSKELVQAIFEATIRILPKVGSRQLTTKKVADIAGVSVGSLYQYFPNKEAILGRLMDSAMENHFAEFERRTQVLNCQSSEDSTNLMIDFALGIFLREKEKNREIFMQAPELGRIPRLFKVRQKVIHILATEMEKHHPGLPPEKYQRISFIAVSSVMGVVHTMLYDETKTYTINDLSVELKTMLNSYFTEIQKQNP